MKIKLISPAIRPRSRWSQIMTLTLPAVAAATPEGHDVWIEDERISKINLDDQPDLVGISYEIFRAPRAYEVADHYRKKGVKVVMGGTHASAMPEEALQHADAVVVGEAEEVWPRVVADAEAGRMQGIYRAEMGADLAKLGVPRLDLLDASCYLPLYPIEATRGCPHACSFCFNRYVHGPHFRTRPVEHVIRDIQLCDREIIIFLDDNLVGDEEFARKLFIEMAPYKKKFFMQTHTLLAENEELLALAARAGCIGVFTGIESVSDATLAEANKEFNRLDRLKRNIGRFHANGIIVDGGLIFGFDTDRTDVFERTLKFIEDLELDSAAVNLLMAYPGTEYYRKFEGEGRIVCHDYTRFTGNRVIVKPKDMTVEQLQAGYDWFNREFYSAARIAKRALASRGAVSKVVNLMSNIGHRLNCSPENNPNQTR